MNIENSVERSPAVKFTCVCCGKVISICRAFWRGQMFIIKIEIGINFSTDDFDRHAKKVNVGDLLRLR